MIGGVGEVSAEQMVIKLALGFFELCRVSQAELFCRLRGAGVTGSREPG